MKKTSLVGLASALLLGAAVIACSAGTGGVGGTSSGSTTPVKEGEVVAPSGLTISATIIAATLGDDCPQAAGAQSSSDAAKCAPSSNTSGGFAPGGCGSFCQQSNVQLSFTAGGGAAGAKIEIVTVTLHDATSGSLVDTLVSRDPRAWNGSAYATWDQVVKPSAETKASYNLTAPKWSTSSYSQKYLLRVTVRVDGGATIILESQTLNREPAVAT